jgi:hypothetical protein
MSRATIGGLSDEQVDAVATGSNVQVTIGSLPNEVRLMLPRALAERLHAALGEALAQDGAPPMPAEMLRIRPMAGDLVAGASQGCGRARVAADHSGDIRDVPGLDHTVEEAGDAAVGRQLDRQVDSPVRPGLAIAHDMPVLDCCVRMSVGLPQS